MGKKLYPPNIEGTLPAFSGTTIVVPFTMNKAVSPKEIGGFVLKVKTVQSGAFILTQTVYFDDYANTLQNAISFDISNYLSNFNQGQHYKIQMAYLSKDNTIGYFSTVGIIKYTTQPEVFIQGLEYGQANTHNYQYVGVYRQGIVNTDGSITAGDITEKAYSYHFNLYDTSGVLIQTSGERIHNSSQDTEIYESTDFYEIQQDLDINKSYFLEYVVTTINKMVVTSGKYRIMQKQSIDPEIKADLLVSLDAENGYIILTLDGHKSADGLEYAATGAFKILRASDEDNFATWNEILKFALYGQQPSRWLWHDMTIKQGVTYKYALQQYNDNFLNSNRLESKPIYSDFEHAFLFDGERQLKIKYNPKISSFKENILENKIDTIGSKYPFIFRNGNVRYKEFPISGLISCQMDESFLFVDEESVANFDGTCNLTSGNIATEREFKLEVLDWLNNGQPKLFRSPSEGNYIVRLLKSTLSPIDSLGRMLHTFSATAYEVAEFNHNNLKNYNLINVADPTIEQLRWETINLLDVTDRNIINYPAVSLRFEGMAPGDILYINDGIKRTNIKNQKETGYYVTIGVTGSYVIDLDANVKITEIIFAERVDDNFTLLQHQGTLTYAYYSKTQNRFDSILDIDIKDVGMQQFIGRHDILNEIENVKVKVQNIHWIRAILREVEKVYKKNNNYYSSEFSTTPITFRPYVIYEVYENKNQKPYWIDGYSLERFDNYSASVYFRKDPYKNNPDGFNHLTTAGMDLTDTFEYYIKNPKDIESLVSDMGVIVEISYQKQILEYSVEDSDKYPELIAAKTQTEELYNILQEITYEENDSIEEHLARLKAATDNYNNSYKLYIGKLEEALRAEEEAQGELV